MSDEEDYMSEAFLSTLTDVRPGLVTKTQQKKNVSELKQKISFEDKKTKPKKVLEKEAREQGLEEAIGASNKGYSLLKKMGFKPGSGLGKNGMGRCEPIPVSVKQGRGGLGRDSEMKRKAQDKEKRRQEFQYKKQRFLEGLKDQFLTTKSSLFNEKEILYDLHKSQKVCEQLDSQAEIKQPNIMWFWPELLQTVDEEECEEEEDDELEIEEKLRILTEYLRTEHLYCVWCAIKFNDLQDLNDNCPGNTSQQHKD